VGNGIIPVVTFIGDSGEESCILELAWTDEASFIDALEGPPPGFFPYPGGGYYFGPQFSETLPGGAAYHIDLFLQAPYTGVWTVTCGRHPPTSSLNASFLDVILDNVRQPSRRGQDVGHLRRRRRG
jgi:hypothetical protein